MPQPNDPAPEHIKDAVAAISDLHAEHYRNAGRVHRLVRRATAFLAKPRTLGVLTVAIVAWIALNLALDVAGLHVLDAPPFPYLADAASILSLYLTAMILITQRHDDDLATRRDQLTLEFAILAEQKTAKIIALLEALSTREHGAPPQPDTPPEPEHPQAMLDALRSAHEALDDPDLKPPA